MVYRSTIRRSLLSSAAILALTVGLGCDRLDPLHDEDPSVAVTAAMDVWLNLMPTFPPLPDPEYVLIEAELTNLSDQPVHVDLESVEIRRADDDSPLFAFALEPLDAWDGRLEPGESSTGQWVKSKSARLGQPECDLSIRGTIRVIVLDQEGNRPDVVETGTATTELACVY